MNIFEKAKLVKSLKTSIGFEFESYAQAQTKTTNLLSQLIEEIYQREYKLKSDTKDLESIIELKDKIKKSETNLASKEQLFNTYGDDPNHKTYWDMQSTIKQLEQDYKYAVKTVYQDEQYTEEEKKYVFIPVGTVVTVTPNYQTVQKTRTVSKEVPDQEKQKIIKEKIDNNKRKIQETPELKQFENIGNVNSEYTYAKESHEQLVKQFTNTQKIEALIERCINNKALYNQHDQKIKKLIADYNWAKETSTMLKNNYESSKEQLISLKQQKFVKQFLTQHAEKISELHNKSWSLKDFGRNDSYLKYRIKSNAYSQAIDNEIKLTPIDYDKLTSNLQEVQTHYQEVLSNLSKQTTAQKGKEISLNQ